MQSIDLNAVGFKIKMERIKRGDKSEGPGVWKSISLWLMCWKWMCVNLSRRG